MKLFNAKRMAALAGGAALALAVNGGAALAQDVTLKLHHFLPIQANLPKNTLEPWADRVEAASDGRIKIERFYGMALGGRPPELMDQVTDGVADITLTLPGYTPGRFPRAEVFELPFMMTDAGATSRAYWDYAEKNMFDTEFADYKVLAVWVHGPGLIHSTDPVRTPDDLSGVKLRSPTRVINTMFSELGATSVGMPVPAVPESLSKGVIDAAVIPWEVTGSLKVPELVTNHTEFGNDALYTAAFVVAMNKGVWDGMPADLQEILMSESGAKLSEMAGRQMQSDDAPARAAAEELGNNIITLSEDEVQVWRDASAGIEATWIADMESKGIDGAALVQDARDLITQYSE